MGVSGSARVGASLRPADETIDPTALEVCRELEERQRHQREDEPIRLQLLANICRVLDVIEEGQILIEEIMTRPVEGLPLQGMPEEEIREAACWVRFGTKDLMDAIRVAYRDEQRRSLDVQDAGDAHLGGGPVYGPK